MYALPSVDTKLYSMAKLSTIALSVHKYMALETDTLKICQCIT